MIKRNNRIFEANQLPVICNMNPRSIYNKCDEFCTLVEQEEIDVIFMSESWERDVKDLEKLINLDTHQVVSNYSQRRGMGGRPAIFVNKQKFVVKDLTNTLIQIPWGVEVVWTLLSPKASSPDSKIRRIACCAIYSRTGSRKKTLLLDHIAESYNLLCKKYGQELNLILAGDTNDLKLDSILSLDQRFAQIVKKWTRDNPKAILDPIIMTLSSFYQEPQYLDPLDNDPEKKEQSPIIELSFVGQ